MIAFEVTIHYDGEDHTRRVSAPVVPRIGDYVECEDFCGHVDGVYHDYRKTMKPQIIVRLK